MHIERLMLNHGLTPYDAAYAAAHQDLLKPSLRKRGKSLGENTRPRRRPAAATALELFPCSGLSRGKFLKIIVRSAGWRDTLLQSMNPAAPTDPELLADWLDHRREAAFRELVARYAGLVQMTARRTCGDDSLATEAAQLTFIALAQKARSLVSCAALGGWLHQTAMLQAKNLLRKSQREHRKRELLQTAMETESPICIYLRIERIV